MACHVPVLNGTKANIDYLERGCYAHIGLRPLGNDENSSSLVIINGVRYEAMFYVGGAYRSGSGLSGRNDTHRQNYTQPTATFKLTRQYKLMRRSGVRFRVLLIAKYPDDDPKSQPATSLAEGLMMVYFNCVTGPNHGYNTPASIDFIGRVRARVPGLPDFSSFGINSAWSWLQGNFCLPLPIKTQPCHQCGKVPINDQGGRMVTFPKSPSDPLGPRLCYRCVMNGYQDVNWMERGNCKWCHMPRIKGQVFNGRGEDSQCEICRHRLNKLRMKGQPVPSKEEYRQYFRGCQNCFLPEWHALGFKDLGETRQTKRHLRSIFHGIGDERRCDACHFYRLINHDERPRSHPEW